MIKTETVVNDEFPYRIEIDGFLGASVSPSGAVIAALSDGSKIPSDKRNRKDAAAYLFWHYGVDPDLAELIHILETDSF